MCMYAEGVPGVHSAYDFRLYICIVNCKSRVGPFCRQAAEGPEGPLTQAHTRITIRLIRGYTLYSSNCCADVSKN